MTTRLRFLGKPVDQAVVDKILGGNERPDRGLKIGGLCTASYVMAKAGLLDGKRATIHWENHDSFTEEFDEVEALFLKGSFPMRIMEQFSNMIEYF